MPLVGEGISGPVRNSFQDAILEQLSRRYEVYSGEKVTKKLNIVNDSVCTAEDCLIKIAQAFNCPLVGRGFVTAIHDEYLISFKIKDIYDDKILESRSEGCAACSRTDVVKLFKIIAAGKTATARNTVSGIFNSTNVFKGPDTAGVDRVTPAVSNTSNFNVAALFFDSNPTGADVYVNDIKIGKTPFSKMDLVPDQTLIIHLKKTFYKDKLLEVAIQSGTNELDTVILDPAFGKIEINSNPEGADLWVGGEKVGKTPYVNDHMMEGVYLLSINSTFHIPLKDKQIEVVAGETFRETYTLESFFGKLSVNSEPENVETIVLDRNNREISQGNTPAFFKLEPGIYKLRLSKQGYEPLEFNVSVAKDSSQIISPGQATLRRLEGKVIIGCTPFVKGTSIYINGEKQSETVPAELILPEGHHEIFLKSQDKKGKEYIKIADRETKTVNVKMKNRGWLGGSDRDEKNGKKREIIISF